MENKEQVEGDEAFFEIMRESDTRKSEYHRTTMRRQNNDTTFEEVACAICDNEPVKPKKLECGYIFCSECLINYLTDQVDQNKFEIVCPSGCGKKLKDTECRILLEGIQLQQYDS